MMSTRPRIIGTLLIAVFAVGPAGARTAQAPKDVVVTFTASDGTPLAGKLSLPPKASGPVPVVFHLHGAGPRTYDHAIQHRDSDAFDLMASVAMPRR